MTAINSLTMLPNLKFAVIEGKVMGHDDKMLGSFGPTEKITGRI